MTTAASGPGDRQGGGGALMRWTMLVTMLLAGCATQAEPEAAPARPWPPTAADWHVEEALALPGQGELRDLAVGDPDPASPGVELVVLDSDGSLHVLGRVDGGWESRQLADRLPLDAHAVAIADVVREDPGDELLLVGIEDGRGAAYVGRRGAGSRAPWTFERFLDDAAPLRAVTVQHARVFVTGDGGRVHLVERSRDGWAAPRTVTLDAPVRALFALHDRVLAACANGTLVEVHARDAAPRPAVVHRGTASLGAVTAEQYTSGTVVGDDAGAVVSPSAFHLIGIAQQGPLQLLPPGGAPIAAVERLARDLYVVARGEDVVAVHVRVTPAEGRDPAFAYIHGRPEVVPVTVTTDRGPLRCLEVAEGVNGITGPVIAAAGEGRRVLVARLR